jgi:hypothetical protein
MQNTMQPQLVQKVAPQLFVPPTARELRAQAVHRLQVGLFGLAAMLLLVGLANIIMDRARLADMGAAGGQMTANGQATVSTDPLADIGVVPSAEKSSAGDAKPATDRRGANR